MSMGDAKIQKITDVNGNERTSRIPQKALNPFIKSKLLTLLKRDDITIETVNEPGSTELIVRDEGGKMLFSYDNAWDYGYYKIAVANSQPNAQPVVVAEMDWFENDQYTNPQQQDIFDIFKALQSKSAELRKIEEGRKNLTEAELQALKSLGFSK